MELFFLPSWPPRLEGFPWFALLLLAAVLAGEFVRRCLRLPAMLGWVACGACAGPSALDLIDAQALASVRWLLDIAIGMVLFELGQRVDYGWLRRNPWLLATSVLESAFGFAAVFLVLAVLEYPLLLAVTAAAIVMATSPVVVMTLAKELRAQGQVTERVLLLTALNCIYALVAVSMLLAWMHAEYHSGWRATAAHPLYLILGSLLAAVILATATLALLSRFVRRPESQTTCVVALVVTAVACTEALSLSVALVLLAYGALTRAWDDDRRFVAIDFGRLGRIAVVLLFALTAATIDLRLLPAGAFAGAVLLAARWAGKALGVFAMAPMSGISLRKASLVALGLMPASGLALVLVHDTSRLFPGLGAPLATVVLSAIAMLEVLGPLTTHFALTRGSEAEPAS